MTLLYRLAPQVLSDLDQIWDYVAADNPTAALRLLSLFEERFLMLARQPLMGELRDELAPHLRSFPAGNYVIFYYPLDVSRETVEIARVLHGARDVSHLFG